LFRRKSLVALIAVCFALGAAVPSLAGKPGSSSGSASISLNQSLAAASFAAWPALGSSVDFTTSYPRSTKNARIDVQCFDASGAIVYVESGDPSHMFMLGGAASAWKTNGGSATCRARLFDLIWNGNNPQEIVWLASTSFGAAG
jgi:hypothetical protein